MYFIEVNGKKEPVYENTDIYILRELEENAEILRSRNKTVYNIICAHDIETTSIINETNDIHLKYDALPYHFQTCICDKVFFQRTLDEYKYFIEEVQKIFNRATLILFVHNLSFEFQHEKHLFNWFEEIDGEKVSTVFAKQGRKVMRARTGTIEFRCSYMLTNKSLARLTNSSKNCTYKKKDGELFDYAKFRTPKTELSNYELEYNYCDVRGLVQCIEEILDTRKRPNGDNYTLLNLPLTSTGFVRDKFKAKATEKSINGKKYRNKLRELEVSLEEFKILSECVFRGGDTHARYPFGDKLLHNVASFDLKSSYPAVMFYGRYPKSKFRNYYNPDYYEMLLETKACYGLFRFVNLKCKGEFYNPYISISKCKIASGSIIDNGRLFFTKECVTWLTDIDFRIIRDLYTWESVEVIGHLRCAEYGYLPNVIRETLLEYWNEKCRLNTIVDYYKNLSKERELTEEEEKELDEYSYEYARIKEYLNGVYGMLVTNPLEEDNNIDENGDWYSQEKTEEEQRELVHRSYCGRTAYKAYQLGVWCTANARLVLHNLGVYTDSIKSGIYRDTDSIKCIFNEKTKPLILEKVAELNEQIKNEVLNCGIETTMTHEYRGYKRSYICGQWEFEYIADDFKTLGAKRYCVGFKTKLTDKTRKLKNIYDINETSGTCKEMEITISGINKKKGAEFLCAKGGINQFKPLMVFDANKCGKQVSHYCDRGLHNINTKDGTFQVGNGICLTESDYNLTVSDTLLSLFQSFGNEVVTGELW